MSKQFGFTLPITEMLKALAKQERVSGEHLCKLAADDASMVALSGQDLCSGTQVALVEDEGGGSLVSGHTNVLKHKGSQEEVVDVEVGREGWDLVRDIVGSSTQSSKSGANVHLRAGNGVVAQVDAQETDMVKLVLGNFLCIRQSRALQCCLLAANDWATAACRRADFDQYGKGLLKRVIFNSIWLERNFSWALLCDCCGLSSLAKIRDRTQFSSMF